MTIMKSNKFYYSLLALGMMTLASCGTDGLEAFDSTTEPVPASCAGVEFASSNKTVFELDPSAMVFNLEVVRKATDAASYNVVVVNNEENAFVVPSTVSFEAGATSTMIEINMADNAPKGKAIALSLSFEDQDLNPYTSGLKVLNVKTTIIKWESIGTGYWFGNIVNYFFGVDCLPLAVEIEKAVTANDTRFRFESPYSRASEDTDENGGFLGYPYNAPEDLNGVVENFVITVTKDGASLAPVNMGMDWGHGDFSCGSVYGYLSQNLASYPLGIYEPSETGGVITFPANSLYVSMAGYKDGGKFPLSNPSILYLSSSDIPE